MTEKPTIPRLFPDTFLIGQVELTGQYTGPIVRGRLFINDQHVSWGGTFNNGFFTYYVGPDRIKRQDKVELVGYDSENNELTRSVVTIKVETENALFKKNESLIRIQAERVDPISTKVVFFSHDRGTAKMYFKLDKDGAPQPLSNGTVVPICLEGGSETSDMGRFRHVYHAVIEDAAEGLVSIILKNNILGHQGRVDGSIYIKPPNDQQLDTAGRFIFHIERSPIDDMSGGADQFYYDGFHEISEKIAEVRRIVSDMTTEAQAEVNKKIADLEAQINQFLQDAQSKFTSLDRDIAAVRQTVTQLENRLTTVKNEIEALLSNISVATRNYLIDSHIERTVSREFLNHPSWDLAPLIDEYGLDRDYSVSFDLKSAIAGEIRVYCQNGSGARYDMGQHFLHVTTEYQRFSITFKPKKSGSFETETRSLLAFFGVYDSGRIPTVRNVSFGLGNIAGDWQPALQEYTLKSDRNLLQNSDFTKQGELNGWVGLYGTLVQSNNKLIYTVTTLDNAARIEKRFDWRQQGEFVLSVRCKSDIAPEWTGILGFGFTRKVETVTGEFTTYFIHLRNIEGSHTSQVEKTVRLYFRNAPVGTVIEIEWEKLQTGRYISDWSLAPEDIANRITLEDTQQKVQTLEQNTIRLTNQFPDPDFQKREPRPFNEGNFAMTYDANGVVLNNTTATKGRVYWATPPLSLAIGRTYNVAMFVNTDAASWGKEIEVGTGSGENLKFTLTNNSPVWIQGTIKLTSFAGFSIWLEPATVLRIRELHIYEANTDITTARIERLEKDNSLPAISPTFDPRFISYSADNGIWHCQVERTGNIVALSGAIANTVAISTTGTEKILMARLPVGYRPKKTVNRVMAGSGTAIFNMEIDPTGEIYMARYRGATTSFTYAAVQFVGAWLNVGTTFLGEDI